LLLELCGGTGLVFMPVMVVWLLTAARQVGRSQWKKGVDLAILAAAAAGYAGVYMVGYARPLHHPLASVDNTGLAILIAGQFLCMGFGLAVVFVWPAIAAGVVGIAGWAALRLFHKRSWGRLAVLAGALLLAAVVGVGRSGFGDREMGLWSRYGLLAWPVLFISFLTFLGASDRYGRWVQPVLAMVAVAFLPFNSVVGWDWATSHDRRLTQFTRDIQAGAPDGELVEKHLLGTGQEERAIRGIPMLRAAGVVPFSVRP
jgi:hypothetical protein